MGFELVGLVVAHKVFSPWRLKVNRIQPDKKVHILFDGFLIFFMCGIVTLCLWPYCYLRCQLTDY